MDLSQSFTLSAPWIEFLYWFGVANLAVGLVCAALRVYAGKGIPLKRAVMFVAAGALFIFCSHQYSREMTSRPAEVSQTAAHSQR